MNPSDIVLLQRAVTMMKISSSGTRRANRSLSQVRADAVSKVKGASISTNANPDASILYSGQEESIPQLREIFESSNILLEQLIDDSFNNEEM